jgi:YHS domain-containing protein
MMARDPVCGMDVDEKTAKWKTTHMGKTFYLTTHMGKTFYFCAPGCQKAFEANPNKYMKM